MTGQEVAEYLQPSNDMLRRLAQSETISASKVGNRRRIRRERISRWIGDMAVSTEGRGSSKDERA